MKLHFLRDNLYLKDIINKYTLMLKDVKLGT